MKLTKRSLVAGIATIALTTVGLAAPASPASAAISDCPAGYVCLWATTNYSGQRWQGQSNNPTLPSWIDQNADSLYNNGNTCEAVFWNGTNYTGTRRQFLRHVGYNLDSYGIQNQFRSQNWDCP